MGRVLRVALLGPLLAGLLSVGGFSVHAVLLGRPTCAAAAWTHRAALVVEHSDGRVLRVCVGFDAATITGDQLLAASGVEASTLGTASFGKEVCQIDGEPATYPNTCWTTTSPYWVMFVSRAGGAWNASTLGVSSQTFADGDAEGFRYDAQSGPEPPPSSPAGTCALSLTPTPAVATRTASATRSVQLTAPPVTAPASAAAPPPPAAAVPVTPGVVSASIPSPATTGPKLQASASGVAVGPLVAAGGGGGLLGLLILSLWRARRR